MEQRLTNLIKSLEKEKYKWDKKLFHEMAKKKPCKSYVYYIQGRLDILKDMIATLEDELEEVRIDELYVRIGTNRKSAKNRS